MGLCNGTRLEVLRMHKNLIECKILTGNRKGEVELIPRVTLNLEGFYPFVLMRHQFPIRLAFSMTINKAQGQTLEYIGIDLRSPAFAHGQLYVALGRTRGYDRIKILLHPEQTSNKTKNVVFKEVLGDKLLED
jgi:ATP-dependent DNA helicase PIF1